MGTGTGVIVAGGRSTRFGDADKAVAVLAGTPMVRRVADRAAPAVDALVVNCREAQVDPIRDALAGYEHPVSFAVDVEPGRGPMAGMRTGLRAVEEAHGGGYALVVACDMPFVDADLVAYLFDRAAGHDAAVPRLGEWFQPTHAVYRVEAMAAACERALERGDRKPIAPIFDLDDYVVVEEDELREHGSLDSFENVNTREEFEEAEARLRSE